MFHYFYEMYVHCAIIKENVFFLTPQNVLLSTSTIVDLPYLLKTVYT